MALNNADEKTKVCLLRYVTEYDLHTAVDFAMHIHHLNL